MSQAGTSSALAREGAMRAVWEQHRGGILAKVGLIEQAVAAQKSALDYSAKQAKAVFQTAKQQLGYAGTPTAAGVDSMQRGMEVVVEAQKDLLDLMKVPIQILH